jgi:hypothetical protein
MPAYEINIQERIRANEVQIQATLAAVAEKFKRELLANVDYHRHLADAAQQSGDHGMALRHRLLAEVYQSTLDRA